MGKSYPQRIFSHAARRTNGSFGFDFPTLAIAAASFLVGDLIYYLLYGWPAMMDQAISVVVYGVAGVGSVVIFLFLFNVVMAPARMQNEADQEIASLKLRLRPSLKLSLELQGLTATKKAIAVNQSEWTGRITMYDWMRDKTFVRILCTNTADFAATSCTAYLLSAFRLTNGRTEEIGYSDNVILTWWINGSDKPSPINIQPSVKHYVNVLSRHPPSGPLLVATESVLPSYVDLFNQNGTYELCVQVSAENVAPSRLVFRIEYDNASGLHATDVPNAQR